VLAKIDVGTWPRSATWHHRRVASDLEIAAARYRAARRAIDDAKAQVRAAQQQFRDVRDELGELIVAEARAGTRVRDLVAESGLSREWVRQLLRAAGVDPD
jgi:hypothetical protein